MSIRDRMLELRTVAERAPLGEAGDRVLRGLLVDLIDVMLGAEANHPDVNGAGLRVAPPPPEKLGVGALPSSPATAAGAVGPASDPAGDAWLAEAQAEFLKRKAEETAAAAAPPAQPKDPKKPATPTPNGGH